MSPSRLARSATELLTWFRRAPEIGKDLPPDGEEAERDFDMRVKRRFPIGIGEDAVLAELRKQGFRLLPEMGLAGCRDATFYRKGLIFKTLWSVRWRAKDGRVIDIWGVHGVRGP